MEDPIQQKLSWREIKLPKNHKLKVRWHKQGSNMTELISIVTHYSTDQNYYLWKVLDDGKLEKVKTKQSPDFSASELNVKR